MPVRYFAFDTETTGLDPHGGDEIISIAWILLDDNLAEVERAYHRVHPSSPDKVSAEAAKINGYSDTLWCSLGAISQEEMVAKLIEVWRKYALDRVCPLGQNVGFDVDFLKALAKTHTAFAESMRVALSYHKLDVLVLARAIDDAHNIRGAHYRLTDLAPRWGISLDNAHDAMADIEATVETYRVLRDHLGKTPTPPEVPVRPWLEKTAGDWCFRFGKHKGQSIRSVDLGYIHWALRNVELPVAERAALVELVYPGNAS